jgi:thioesterase domain-containing protein
MHGPKHAAGSVEDIARSCVGAIHELRPEGPYFLFGHSLGGVVVYDIARQLGDAGQRVGLVALADSPHPRVLGALPGDEPRPLKARLARVRRLFTRQGARKAIDRLRALSDDPAPEAVEYVPGTDQPLDYAAAYRRHRNYRPESAPGPVVVYATPSLAEAVGSSSLGWEPLITDEWEVHEVPGSHHSMLGEPHVHVLAEKLGERLRRAQKTATS